MMLGEDRLSVFLRDKAAEPFTWGYSDCLTRLADWVRLMVGRDPAAALRGSYSSKSAAARLVLGAGGMANLVESRLAPLGIARAAAPARGDIALVKTVLPEEGFGGLTGALVLEGSTAAFADNGLLIRSFDAAPVVIAWRIAA